MADHVSTDAFSGTKLSDCWTKKSVPPVVCSIAGTDGVESMQFILIKIIFMRDERSSSIDTIVIVVADFISDEGDVARGAIDKDSKFGV